MTNLTSNITSDQVGTIFKTVRHTDYATVENKTYDVFGNVISQSGSSTGNLGFQSKYFDTESGMNYYYHRYYKPETVRFLNEDPIGLSGDLCMYGFVGSDPINYIDPYGLLTDSNHFANPSKTWPTPQKKMPLWDAFKSSVSQIGDELRKLICGEKKECDDRSYCEKVSDNFSEINSIVRKRLIAS